MIVMNRLVAVTKPKSLKRHMSSYLCGLLVSLLAVTAHAKNAGAPLDPNDPQDALKLYRKIACNSYDDATTRFEVFSGRAFRHQPGKVDFPLFNIIGSNVRRCETVHDRVRGTGFRTHSNVILLYVDKETGNELTAWTNPITQERIQVSPLITSNQISEPVFPIGGDGKLFQITIEEHPYLSYMRSESSIATDSLTGGTYVFSDLITRVFLTNDLFDSHKSTLSTFELTWTRMSSWPKWMKMDGTRGELLWHVTAMPVSSLNNFPPRLEAILTEKYAAFKRAPQ